MGNHLRAPTDSTDDLDSSGAWMARDSDFDNSSTAYTGPEPSGNVFPICLLYVKEKQSTSFYMPVIASFAGLTAAGALQRVAQLARNLFTLELFELVTVFELGTIFSHVLLVVQLSYFSSASLTSIEWAQFGYFLECFFIAEMLLRMLALGEKRFVRNTAFVIQIFLNVAVFGCMVAMGDNIYELTDVYLLLVLFQCMRLLLVFWMERGEDRLRSITAKAARALFLVFATIYIFSIVAQYAYCGVLSSDGTSSSYQSSLLMTTNFLIMGLDHYLTS
jgi:hypothetical protein